LSPAALLAAVERAGGQVKLVDDRLRLSAPLGAVPPELLAQMRAHRAAVLSFLAVEDLRGEGTTLARELARLRRELPVKPPNKPPTQAEQRWRRWAQGYNEIRPTPGCPSEPCACGDRVFFRLGHDQPWRCRTCERADARLRVQRCWIAPAGTATTTTPAQEL
jgi:hypothetical protein